jgi:prolyl oligopeptidase
MRTRVSGVLAVLLAVGAAFAQPPVYPKARTVEQVDEYHGVKVPDPYAWLEEADTPDSKIWPEVKAWIEAENTLTFGYLERIPQRAPIKERLTALWDYEKFGIPEKEGGRYFFTRNNGLQNQNVLYWAPALDATPQILIDPNLWSKDGTIAMGGTAPSDDGKYLAYAMADAGSDWRTWRVFDLSIGQLTTDELKWTKFGGADWASDSSGFYYNRSREPAPGSELKAADEPPQLCFHKLGTAQSEDVVVFERPDQRDWTFGGTVPDSGDFLVITISKAGDVNNNVSYIDLRGKGGEEADTLRLNIALLERQLQKVSRSGAAPENTQPARDRLQMMKRRLRELAGVGPGGNGVVELLKDWDAEYGFIDHQGPVFWFLTDNDAPRRRVVAININRPQKEHWVELVPQSQDAIQGVSVVGGHFIVQYLQDARSLVKVFDLTGKHVRDVDLPGIGTAIGFAGKNIDDETFYSFTGYSTPTTIYRYDVATGVSTVFKQPKVAFNPSDYTTSQVFFNSKDGTRVPMFISHKKGAKQDGTTPTLLYGYGGFDISITPTFSPANLLWMEMGGIYAVPNLRGGGEYGRDWHLAGTKTKKQNVFDDFIAAAEHLIKEKYTSTPKLAIAGGSNGGLLVGACMTQRPELYGACLPAVGVMDMLKYHTWTVGRFWEADYGSVKDEAEFKALLAYSPYQNLRSGTCYPPTLITTADHDDRVYPAHSFKFAAAAQAAQACENPILIRIETRAGHGAGKPTTKRIEEISDQLAFLVKNLKMNPEMASPAGAAAH